MSIAKSCALWACLLRTLVVALSTQTAPAQSNVPPELFEDPHVREELGVNQFTAPSIDKIFRELQALRPLPFGQLEREIDSSANYGSRALLALNFGMLVGDGFLAVEAERPARVEEIGRSLLRLARALGVSQRITRHAKSLIDAGRSNEWPTMRKELTATQTDVEASIMELRDEELAHLVALGGWLRGLEIATTAIDARYDPDRAAILKKIDLLDYFIDRLDTLHPDIRKLPEITRLTADLKTIQSVLSKPNDQALDRSDVKQILKLVSGINRALSGQKEPKKPE